MLSPAGPPFPIRTVAIIGAGPAGRNFAQAALAAGLNVVLEDVLPANLRRADADLATALPPGDASRLRLVLTVEDAVREADLAVDFVPDELESKLEIFSMIDRMAPPRTVLCSPSEALSITDLASCTYRPDRCLILRGARTVDGWNLASATRLLHPPAVAPAVLAEVEAFFEHLGVHLTPEPDTDAPMLVKNIPATP